MGYIRRPNTVCLICSKPVYRRKSQIARNNGHVFCNMVCYGKFNRKEQPCLICGTLIQAHFNKITCSRACANKHRTGIKYKLNRPRDIEILHVHHIDRNRKNNNLTNLKLICPNCHYEEHYLEKSWLRKYDFESWRKRLA